MTSPRAAVAASGFLPFVFLFVAANTSAQTAEPLRTIVAEQLRSDETTAIDGRLIEDAWSRAQPAVDFRQQDPQNGEAATEPTEVRIVYDKHRIILGIRCLDSQARELRGNQMQRDQSLAGDDRFMIALDTYSDGRTGYYFEINPSGAMGDGLVVAGTGMSVDRSWDGIWNVRVDRTDEGWTAEIELPLRTINFDAAATQWGINFQRTIRRKNEEVLWSGWARNQGLTYMAAAGRVEGLEGLTQGLGLDLIPYLLGTWSEAPGRDARSSRRTSTIGGDIAYNLTPSLRANVSLNTDFAETEVDQRQVNLTRFPLFFPEKRAFFLEGAGTFDFSREPGNAITPFFSRRLGLDAAGVPQPIDYGAKLTGQAGAFDIGALHVRTRARDTVAAEDFTVVRSRRRFWRQSYVGGIYTARQSADARVLQTAGIDVALATSQFLERQVLELSGFYVNTSKLPGSRGGTAFGGRLSFPNDPWNIRVSVHEVQDGYDPAIGFVDRRGYRLFNPGVRRIFHTERHPVVRQVSFEADLSQIHRLDGAVETRTLDVQLVRVILQAGDSLEYHLRPLFERLPRDFPIFSGVTLPAGGQYSFLRRRFVVQSAPRRPVSINATYEDGAFYSGTRRQVVSTLGIRPHRGWLVSIGADYNQIRLDEGSFTTKLWQGDVNTQFSPFISIVNRVQFDSVTRQLGWQARFRWITTPGNDIFVVYMHNWTERDGLHTLDRRGSIKIVRTFRF